MSALIARLQVCVRARRSRLAQMLSRVTPTVRLPLHPLPLQDSARVGRVGATPSLCAAVAVAPDVAAPVPKLDCTESVSQHVIPVAEQQCERDAFAEWYVQVRRDRLALRRRRAAINALQE